MTAASLRIPGRVSVLRQALILTAAALVLGSAGSGASVKQVRDSERQAALDDAARLGEEARWLYRQRRLPQAIAKWEQKLALERGVHGDSHDDVLDSVVELASWRRQNGQLSEAEKLLKETVAKIAHRPEVMPWRVAGLRADLETIKSLATLAPEQRLDVALSFALVERANTLKELGKPHEAVSVIEKAVDIRRRLLGNDHHEYALALCYRGMHRLGTGDFGQAQQSLEQAAGILERGIGRDFREYATAINGLGTVAYGQKNYAGAESCYRRSLEIRRRVLGERHAGTLKNLEQLSDVLERQLRVRFAQRDFVGAHAILEKALVVETERYGKEHWKVTHVQLARAHVERMSKLTKEQLDRLDETADLIDKASRLQKGGSFLRALATVQQALDLRKELLGATNPAVLECLELLVDLQRARQEHDRADELLRDLLQQKARVFGKDHPSYLESLAAVESRHIELSADYLERLDFARARAEMEAVVSLRQERDGKDHWKVSDARANLLALNLREKLSPDQVKSLAELSRLDAEIEELVPQNRLAESLQRAQRALELYRSLDWEQHRDHGYALNRLGWHHDVLGNYAEAERFYALGLKFRREALGDDHPVCADSLANLGSLYMKLGDPGRAETHLRAALLGQKRTRGEAHKETGRTLNNLGMLHLQVGEFARAEPLLREALNVFRASGGAQGPDYARAVNNLAGVYQEIGAYELAEPLFREASALWEASGHQADYARSLDNLGGLYLRAGDYPRAERHYREAGSIFKEVLGTSHPDYAASLRGLAVLHGRQGRWSEWAGLLQEAERVRRRHTTQVLPGLSEREQLQFLRGTHEPALHDALGRALTRRFDPDVAARSAEWVLNGKAIAHQALAERALLARARAGEQTKGLVDELVAVRAKLAMRSMNDPRPGTEKKHRAELAGLLEHERDLAKRLAHAVGRAARDDPWVGLAEVRKAIPQNGVLVDIVRLPAAVGLSAVPGAARYAACVVPAEAQEAVHLIDLGLAEEIEDAVWRARAVLQNPAKSPAALAELSKILLAHLRKHLETRTCWLICPDADLWLIPWEALLLREDRYVLQDHEISYLVTSRDLVQPGWKAELTAPVVMADPNYDLAPDRAAEETKRLLTKPAEELQPPRRAHALADLRFDRLPDTEVEARAVAPKLEAYCRAKPVMLLGGEALEGVFRALRQPRVLLLSTHGFVREDQDYSDTSTPSGLMHRGVERLRPPRRRVRPDSTAADIPIENPLLRCGLALAGANNRAHAKDGHQDGMLTGLEIVGVDLRGTELVVLSACQTGVGRVHQGEGVAGLRQAFHLAGARAVVATLWKIPDDETADLMTRFFDKLAQGVAKAKALTEAQREMIAKARADGKDLHPFYWAAFTLTGYDPPSK